jgi:hypothetical protein
MKAKVRKSLNFLLQLFIIIIAYGFLYRELFTERDFTRITGMLIERVAETDFIVFIAFALLLMPLNIAIEAEKWKYLIGKYEKVPFLNAYKAVFSGFTVSVFTPNRIGEYFGRVFILKHLHPLKGVLITFIGSMGQLMATLITGLFALLFFMPKLLNIYIYPNHLLFWGIVIATLIVLTMLALLFLNFAVVSVILKRLIPWGRDRYEKYTSVFESYQSAELAYVLFLSLLRYFVFTTQFILLLYAFEIGMPLKHFLIVIPLVFLAITIIPTIALTELGIRGSLSLYLMGFYLNSAGVMSDETTLGIFAASTILWLINLAIPAITGTFFIFNLRFIRSKQNNGGS